MYRDKAIYTTIRFPIAEADVLREFADRTRCGNVTGVIRDAVRTFIAAGENVKAEKNVNKVMEKT
jgi:hypothetical protein